MLRSLTRKYKATNSQSIIDKATEVLTTTNLSISEIIFQLGFEYPQSLSKLFKNKTKISPLEFRKSFD